MSRATIDRQVFGDPSWWHWVCTVPLLAASLAGHSGAIEGAMVMCAAVGLYFLVRLRRLRPFPVQVRIAYLGLLAIGTLPWMQWLHWVQLVGTTTMVTVGYCPLIRMLSLAPLNRSDPLTRSLLWRIFVQEPCVGGLVHWSVNSASGTMGSCSMPAPGSLMSCSLPNQTFAAQKLDSTRVC